VVPLAVGLCHVSDRGERLDGLAQSHIVTKQSPADRHCKLRAELLIEAELENKTGSVQRNGLNPVRKIRREPRRQTTAEDLLLPVSSLSCQELFQQGQQRRGAAAPLTGHGGVRSGGDLLCLAETG
jgi:hypothetical protein